MKRSIAKGPKAGVAFREPLEADLIVFTYGLSMYLQESVLQLIRRDPIGVIRRWSKRDWKVAKGDVKKCLRAS